MARKLNDLREAVDRLGHIRGCSRTQTLRCRNILAQTPERLHYRTRTVPLIREEIPDDYAAIRELNRLAFGGNDEAEILDRLRSAGIVVVSLVAVENDEIVGHVMFSDLPIETDHGIIGAVSLAPMAVHQKCQHQGIGSALVRQGLEFCRERGKSIVVVVGHPGYYPRFGFSSELATKFHGPFSGDAWMALELKSGALENVKGTVRYPEAFGDLDN